MGSKDDKKLKDKDAIYERRLKKRKDKVSRNKARKNKQHERDFFVE